MLSGHCSVVIEFYKHLVNMLMALRCCYGEFLISAAQSYTIVVNYFRVVVKRLVVLLYLHSISKYSMF